MRFRLHFRSIILFLFVLVVAASVSTVLAQKSSNGGRVYVSNVGNSTISVIDVKTDMVVATIPHNNLLGPIATSPDGTRLYIVNLVNGSNTISVMDTANDTVIATIALPAGVDPVTTYLTVNPVGTRVYVAHYSSADHTNNKVSVIDAGNNTLITSVDVGPEPKSIAVNPLGTHIYVSHGSQAIGEFNYSLDIVDTATNTVIDRVKEQQVVIIGSLSLAFSRDGSKLYGTANGVTIVNTATNTASGSFVAGESATGIAVNPTTDVIYAASSPSNSLSVIDPTNSSVIALPIGTGPREDVAVFFPRGVAANSSKVFVTNERGNSVTIIDAAKNVVETTVGVGAAPRGIAIAP